MCGIYGFAGFQETGLLDRMDELLVHRGPDGNGSFVDERLAMGMRRLAIIDLATGDQPMISQSGDWVICTNGEIYNYLELREDLERRGHVFRTRSDTEVLVEAFAEWGIDCLARLNGMFAFAVYNRRTGDLWLARDRCGQKPLYWWSSGESAQPAMAFASEAKALLASRRIPARMDLAALDPYLTLRYVPEPQTMFEGIHTLPAAHWLHRDPAGAITIQRYWDIQLTEPGSGERRSDADWLQELESLFEDAIRLTMRSDVPVAAYLSAGVDSSLIVAAMRRLSEQVHTFSIGFGSPQDETAQAARTAALLGTTHHEVRCAAEDFSLLPQVVWHMDRPVGDALILAFYKLAQAAGRDFKVVLGGEGADEMFAGYGFHKVIPAVERLRRLLPAGSLGGLLAPLLRHAPLGLLDRFSMFPAALGRQGRARVADFLARYESRDLAANAIALRTLWSRDARAGVYASERRHLAAETWFPPVRDGGGAFLDRLLKLQYDDWLQDWAIIRQDKNTMAHGLEIRLPFLDHRLIELAFRMPPRLKAGLTRDKIIERRLAARLLPAEVAQRPKIPFYLPMDVYYQHPVLREMVADTLSPQRVAERGLFDPQAVQALVGRMAAGEFLLLKQVMSLVILELWQRAFIDDKARLERHVAPA